MNDQQRQNLSLKLKVDQLSTIRNNTKHNT